MWKVETHFENIVGTASEKYFFISEIMASEDFEKYLVQISDDT